jgi:5-hydroxyisourate hydrolase-like protein (transthyretin family)
MSDHITVAFAMKEMADVRITLINLQGQTVKLLTAETIASGNFKHSYGVEGIAPGMYLVKVQIGDNYAISKVVKE